MRMSRLLLLPLCLLLLLGGCSRPAAEGGPSPSLAGTDAPETVYVLSTVDYQADCLFFSQLATAGTDVYFTGTESGGTVKLFRAPLSGGACTLLAAYTGSETASYTLRLRPAADGIWLLVSESNPETGDVSNQLIQLDADGIVAASLDLSALQAGSFTDLALFGTSICLLGTQRLYLLDPADPAGQRSLALPDGVAVSLLEMQDGQPGLLVDHAVSGMQLYPLSADGAGFDEPRTLDLGDAARVFACDADGAILYGDPQGLHRLAADGTDAQLFDWAAYDLLYYDINDVCALADGRIALLAAGEKRLYLFSPASAASVTPEPEKTVLTLACLREDYTLSYAVAEFNRTHSDFEIQLSVYGGNDADTAARLQADILAGNVPDLLAMQDLPYAQYAAAGLLEDLRPYLEADPVDLLPGVLEALEIDGGVYQLCMSFQLVTAFASRTALGSSGEAPGWLPGERDAILATGQPLFGGAPSNLFDAFIGPVCMMDYVDWETMTCTFDSPSFLSLLEALGAMEQAPAETGLLSPSSPFSASIYLTDALSAGEGLLIKGLPVAEGGGSRLLIRSGVAMTSACTDKDAAWEFLRYLLSEDFQTTRIGPSAFCTNAATFQTYCDRALEALPDGADRTWAETCLQMLRDAIASSDGIVEANSPVLQIIREEVTTFLNGVRSAEETAALIQQRVEIYLAEQS